MKTLAVAAALAVVGCGGYEYEPSDLSQMDVAGVWSEVFRSEDPPGLFPTDVPIHHHDTGIAYITPQVTVEEMAHVLTHVWIRRDALRLTEQQMLDSEPSMRGDPDHLQPVWAANQPADDVLERAAARYLREHYGR